MGGPKFPEIPSTPQWALQRPPLKDVRSAESILLRCKVKRQVALEIERDLNENSEKTRRLRGKQPFPNDDGANADTSIGMAKAKALAKKPRIEANL